MLRLLVIRHGESTSDLEPRRIEGMADFPLSDMGHRQAQALGQRVAAEYHLDDLIASPLTRARQTAGAISAATGVPVRIDERIREKSYGRLGGLTFTEADEQYPGLNWRNFRVHEFAPEGETLAQQFSRVAEFWFSLLPLAEQDRTIGVVAHGGTIQCLYRAALGLPVNANHYFGTADTSLHVWHVQPNGSVTVRLVNCIQHLKGL